MEMPAHVANVTHRPRGRSSGRRPRRTVGLLATTVALVFFAASTALAAHLALTLGASSNATLGERVVVTPQGRTLYTLTPETSRHLLCRASECLRLWPPLTVDSTKAKLKNGAGVHGRLGILRRANGMLQVTLRGLPLYRYSKDHAKGQANGEGLQSFGGTWHAMTATSGERPRKPAMTPTQPVAPPPPSYPSSQPSEPTTTTPSTPTTTTPTTTTTTTTTTPTPPPYPYPPY
jgi:predicted lipoprotein with Yx(FWY)xxD motif